MNFIKWFFSEARYFYLCAITIFILIVLSAFRSIESFRYDPWTIPVFILIVGGFAAGIAAGLIGDYERSQK